MTRWWTSIPLMLFIAAVATPGWAQDRGARGDDAGFRSSNVDYEPPPRDRLYYTNATFIRYNPIGLVNVGRVGWRRRLSPSSHPLLRDTYLFVAPQVFITPASARGGLYAEVQALSIFRVFAELNATQFFGTFGQVLGYPDTTLAFSDQTLRARRDESGPAFGTSVVFGASVRLALGPIAMRSTANFTRFDVNLPEGAIAFYNRLWDRLLVDGRFNWLQDTDVLFVHRRSRIGVRYTVSDDLDGNPGVGGESQHRLGPLFAYQFINNQPGARFNQATLFVVAQWWLKHPYRTGQEQPAALPLMAVGFTFNGDFAVSKD